MHVRVAAQGLWELSFSKDATSPANFTLEGGAKVEVSCWRCVAADQHMQMQSFSSTALSCGEMVLSFAAVVFSKLFRSLAVCFGCAQFMKQSQHKPGAALKAVTIGQQMRVR
jgi:hypothetical protein